MTTGGGSCSKSVLAMVTVRSVHIGVLIEDVKLGSTSGKNVMEEKRDEEDTEEAQIPTQRT